MTRIDWRAGKDLEAHAHTGDRHRTACGQQPIDPRFSWPAVRRCKACEASIANEAASAAR